LIQIGFKIHPADNTSTKNVVLPCSTNIFAIWIWLKKLQAKWSISSYTIVQKLTEISYYGLRSYSSIHRVLSWPNLVISSIKVLANAYHLPTKIFRTSPNLFELVVGNPEFGVNKEINDLGNGQGQFLFWFRRKFTNQFSKSWFTML
jgi:hypothetical protein